MPIRRLFRNNDYHSPSFDYYYNDKPKFNWNNALNNTQRTLSIINSALPLIHQVKPMLTNTSTMLRIYKEMNRQEPTQNSSNERVNSSNITNSQQESGPKFFI